MNVLKCAIEQARIDAEGSTQTLTKNTFREFMIDRYTHNTRANMCNHGADGGFPDMTTYFETSALYEKYQDDIWDMLNDDCLDMGEKTTVSFIATLGGVEHAEDDMTFKNLLVWYAAEKVAFDTTQGEYVNDEDDE